MNTIPHIAALGSGIPASVLSPWLLLLCTLLTPALAATPATPGDGGLALAGQTERQRLAAGQGHEDADNKPAIWSGQGIKLAQADTQRPQSAKIAAIIEAAEAGDVSAQFRLGMAYAKGEGVPKDGVEAAIWFRRAAEQGHAAAQYSLGVMYDKGRGVPQDYAVAAKWYGRASEQGHISAQYNLGIMYGNGQGVPQDYAEAVKWFRRAAEQGDASAQFNLGVMYDNGRGVPQDDAAAAKWYRRAAEQGDADAQYNLGVMYAKGEGVPKNNVEAIKWTRMAAVQGHEDAKENLAILRRRLADEARAVYMKALGAYSSVNYPRARNLFARACDLGGAVACRYAGLMFRIGKGGPVDKVRARESYGRSCRHDNYSACAALEDMLAQTGQ